MPDPVDDPRAPDLSGLDRRMERDAAAVAASAGVSVAPGEPPSTAVPPVGPPPKSSARNIAEWSAVILGALIIAVVIRTTLFQTFWIPSPSMATTLVKDDRVLVNKLSYKFHDPNRGDVVVFRRPPNEPPSDIKDLIKRVIGLPGERISITDGKVHINGRQLDEPYVNGLESIYSVCGAGEVSGIDTEQGFTIPAGHVFVMGDNRTDSHDSRCFGPIDEDLIVGRAFLIIWPPSKMGGL